VKPQKEQSLALLRLINQINKVLKSLSDGPLRSGHSNIIPGHAVSIAD